MEKDDGSGYTGGAAAVAVGGLGGGAWVMMWGLVMLSVGVVGIW